MTSTAPRTSVDVEISAKPTSRSSAVWAIAFQVACRTAAASTRMTTSGPGSRCTGHRTRGSGLELAQPTVQVPPLPIVDAQVQGAAVRRPRLVVPVEPPQQLGPGRVQVRIAVELRGQPVGD